MDSLTLTILICIALAVTSVELEFNSYIDFGSFKDLTCIGSEVVFTSVKVTKAQCGLACENKQECLAFTFRTSDGKCVGCKAGDSNLTLTETGMNCFMSINRMWGADCTSDDTCIGGNQQCIDGVCGCKPGYSFQKTNWTCVANCPTYGNTFQKHTKRRLFSNNFLIIRKVTVNECRDACLSSVSPVCVTFDTDVKTDGTTTCLLQPVTAIDKPHHFENSSTFDHYQRNC